MTEEQLSVLIATPLEPEHVARIEAVDPRLRVLYEPDLLPVPRYPADHGGVRRELSAAGQARWSQLRREAEVSFDFDWQEPAQIVANCPELRWVQATSAGIGGFLQRTGLADSPLVFTTAAGVHGVPLAEFTLLGLLYFAKGMPVLNRWKAERHWERHATGQLAGSQALVVGLGGIGVQVARLLSAAGVSVCGAGRPGRTYDIPGVTGYVDTADLGHVLPDMDAVILACPLTPETEGLIGARELAQLPPGAVLVNLARGQVVDEDALTAALASGHLGGACLDVFATEPLPESSPLWGMDNVIVSPHSASTAEAENGLITELFCINLRRYLDEAPLRNVFSRSAGY
jgi:phosphoglycerate dehydrogenase-like enzyme